MFIFFIHMYDMCLTEFTPHEELENETHTNREVIYLHFFLKLRVSKANELPISSII